LAASNASVINVPYGAFGAYTYQPLQFVEGAIDVTALIGGSGLPNECGSLPFKSLFIKTKSSAERTADLKDLIAPLQLNACFDHTAPVLICPPTLNLQGCNPIIPQPSFVGGSATDNCNDVIIPVASDGPIASNGCSRTMNRRWVASDACGNMSSCIQQINWTVDITPPSIITGGTSNNLGCNPSAGDINGALGTASATDGCGTPTVSAASDGAVSSNGCSRSQTRSWSAVDACGNTSTASRTVTWTFDNTAPAFTGNYDDVTLTCNSVIASGSLGSATATDACSTPTITPNDGSIVTDGCFRSLTRTFTASDACGNTATISRTVRWKALTIPPVLLLLGQPIIGTTSIDLGCNPPEINIEATLGTANATNGCATPTVTALTTNPTGSTSCERVRVRTFTATDDCGHVVTAARLVRWIVSLGGPQINPNSAPTVLGCNPTASDIEAALGSVSATDACANVTITPSDGSIESNGCSRSKTRTWTATGGCGNTATASRTVTWTADNNGPTITTGGTGTSLGCNPTTDQINGALGTATATDACSTPTTTPNDGPVTSQGCSRSQTRTWTSRDACGNTSTAARTVTWTSDNTGPVITTGGTGTSLGCNPTTDQINGALGTATATDACSTPTTTPNDGAITSDGCSRSQTRTWTSRDACGNTSTAARTVTWTSDNTGPVITTGGTGTSLGCNPTTDQINGALGTATATDACSTPTTTPVDGPITSDGCSRSQTRTWTSRDACGNTSTAARTVTWTSDNTGPVITTGGTGTSLGCNPTTDQINGALGTATATDACSTPTTTPVDGPVTSQGCSRSQTRTWTSRDACGNTSTAARTVTWTSDNTGPVITTGGTGTSLGCNPTTDQINGALGTATATDACSTPTTTPVDGAVTSDGCSRSQTRTWTSRDACGNTSTAARTVTWTSDNTGPVITTGGTGTSLGCNPTTDQINGALGTATATDACSTPTTTPNDGPVTSQGCSRSQTRTWTSRDACGNTSTAARTVTWTSDNTGPVITTGGTGTSLGCNPTTDQINGALGTATATDVCSTPTTTPNDGPVTSQGCSRSQTRTWTSRDACGNTSTAARTVTWTSDNTGPVITTGGTGTSLGCNPTTDQINGALGTATATDACSTPTTTPNDGPVTSRVVLVLKQEHGLPVMLAVILLLQQEL
jgi:predicted RNA-binding Zn ribbon-like protein